MHNSDVHGGANFAPAVAAKPQPYHNPWEASSAATGASFRAPETLSTHHSIPGGPGLTTQFTITSYDARAGVGKLAAAVGAGGGGAAGGASTKHATSTLALPPPMPPKSSPTPPPMYQPSTSLTAPVLVDFKLSPIVEHPPAGRPW